MDENHTFHHLFMPCFSPPTFSPPKHMNPLPPKAPTNFLMQLPFLEEPLSLIFLPFNIPHMKDSKI